MNYLQFILILVAITGALIESVFDGKKIRQNKKIEHKLSGAVRILIAFGLSHLFFIGLLYPVLMAVSMLLAFWIVFDPAVNIHAGRSPYYMGKTATLDKIPHYITYQVNKIPFMRGFKIDMIGWTALKGLMFFGVTIAMNYV